jgi:hypothetical protein
MQHSSMGGTDAVSGTPGLHRRQFAAAAFLLMLAGCRPAEVRSEKPIAAAAEQLLAIGTAYRQFTFDEGRPPKGPDDLRRKLSGDGAFISPRDGKPFTVFWGVDLRAMPTWAARRPVLAHEAIGVAGSRYTLSFMGNVELLTEQALRESSFPPGHQAP